MYLVFSENEKYFSLLQKGYRNNSGGWLLKRIPNLVIETNLGGGLDK